MNKLRKWTPISCALLSIAAYSVAITCGANAQSEMRSMLMPSKAALHKVASTVPAPQSGIKLIEYISQKMHLLKSPVIAKNATYSQAPLEKSQGPTNQLLAIKPPVTGYSSQREQDRDAWSDKNANEESKKRKADEFRSDKIAAADDGLIGSYRSNASQARRAMLASVPTNAAKKESQTAARDREQQSAVFGRMANGPLAGALANLKGSLQQLDSAQHAAEGGKDLSARSRVKSSRSETISYQIASNKPSGFWERGQLLQQQGISNSVNIKDARMSSSAGTAGGAGGGSATDTLAEAPAQEPKAPPMPPSMYRTTYNSKLPSVNMGKAWVSPGDNQYDSSGAGGVVNIRDYAKSAQMKSAYAPPLVSLGSPVNAPAFMPPPVLVDTPQATNFNSLQKQQKTEIALLPPNVITGIPLVRLGSSALDANKALLSVKGNKLKQQSISGWTVYVLHKANSSEPAMQVYLRHGLVEALRIFDNAFIAPDFGVQLNDDLSTVKAKFGEPTFMLPEPDCPSAKNYVYPISQVSFELARANNSPNPKVVSVLIFTVK